MNMFDEARSIRGMMEIMGISQSEMAKRLGVSQSYVANKIRLLQLGDELESIILTNRLTERHARSLLKLSSDESRREALEKIINRGLTVAESEAVCDLLRDGSSHSRIPLTTRAESIRGFKDGLKCSVETLRSIGVDISKTVGFYGNKTYITLCISE